MPCVGYGSVAPRTQWGKVITIVYALIGIPLMLVYLSTVGDVLARSFRRMYGRLCGHSGTSSGCNGRSSKNASGKAKLASTGISATTESYLSTGYTPSIIKSHNSISSDGSAVKVHHYPQNITGDVVGDDVAKIDRVGSGLMIDCGGDGIVASSASSSTAMNPNNKHHHHHFRQNEEAYCSETVRVPISLCLLIILLYICAGAFLFNRLENWTFLEGSYFCFTSLGTIGFGDLIPGLYHSYQMQYQSSPSISSTAEQISVFASSTYILFGMALIAMCFNLVQDEVVIIVRRLGQFFGVCTSHGSGISKGNADDEDMKTEKTGLKPSLLQYPKQHHSLPRRKLDDPLTSVLTAGKGDVHRNIRVSGDNNEPLVEYFVPRSVSEFNIAGVVSDTVIVPPPSVPEARPSPANSVLRNYGGSKQHLDLTGLRAREKMVTFEDDPFLPNKEATITKKTMEGALEDVFM
uniref:Potassium channel domain-containing protein n=1 Tax=Timema shepardi TaxID=629360 RepID=A0A7R9B2C6_TIMSH|nr:unnamed protein product [Timema shepardi]